MRTNFRMTKERCKISELLCRYMYLRTHHFYVLLCAQTEGAKRAIRRLLLDFSRHRYVVRRPVVEYEDPHPLPRYENVYWLSQRGVRLAHDCEVVESFSWSDKSPWSLEHDVSITDFHLAVERAVQGKPVELYWRQDNLKRGINPDALFAITERTGPANANTFYYFLEIERSRQGNYRDGISGLIRKLDRYYEYQGSDECRKDWKWFSEFRVVIVLKTESRQKHLLAQLETRLPSRMFWVTTADADMKSAVFLTPTDHRTERYSLIPAPPPPLPL